MAEAASKEPTKPKRGLLSILLLAAIVAIVAVGGWFGFDYYKKKKAGPQTAEETGSTETTEKKAEGGHGGGHGKDKPHNLKAPARLAMPVAESALVFVPGNPNTGIPPRIVSTNAFQVNGYKKPEEIVIMFADTTKKKHYAVAQIYLAGPNTELLMRTINEKQAILFESITNMLSAKLYKDTKTPGFKKILRSEIIGLANQVLETNLVQEAIIPKFVTQ